MHDKEKEILETEAKTKIETRRVALDKYKEVPTQYFAQNFLDNFAIYFQCQTNFTARYEYMNC
jgi:hypothetical protein